MPDDPERLHRIAEGREAEIFAWEAGKVLKLYRSRSDAPSAEWEAAATAAVVAAGGRAPHPFGLVTVRERPGLILEHVDGPDLVTIMARKPWTVRSAGELMGRAHVALHAVIAPTTLPTTREHLERRIRRAGGPVSWQDAALRRLEALPDGDRLCHNDFHPQNVLLTAEGPIGIDWPAATRGDPAADVARTVLLLTVGAPLPSAPLRVRLLAPVMIGLLRRSYLAAYRATRPLTDASLRAWLLPQAIARLAESIPGERGRLDRLIQSLVEDR